MYKKILKNKLLTIRTKCNPDTMVTVKGSYIKIYNPTLEVDLEFYVSKGNKKLPKDCYIFNISSSHDCISNKLNLCNYGLNGDKSCYGLKAERQYKDCLKCRKEQERAWNEIKDKNLIYDFIMGLVLMSLQSNKHQMKELRFNESGDIKDVLDIIFFETVARELNDIGTTVYTYTHRKDLINSIKARTDYLIVNGSDFMLHNEFKVVDKFTGTNKECKMDCSICNYCKIKWYKTIEVLKH